MQPELIVAFPVGTDGLVAIVVHRTDFGFTVRAINTECGEGITPTSYFRPDRLSAAIFFALSQSRWGSNDAVPAAGRG